MKKISFNKPYMTGKELFYIAQAHFNGMLAGNGAFTKQCEQWLENTTGTEKALLTHSCTAALEIAALLVDVQPNDEIIMPSYTFVSTANAFVLRGAKPVFVDIRPDTLNIDETQIEAAITKNTKAIVPVHYSGVGCEMDTIMQIAQRYKLWVIEDAAQGVMAQYKNKALGHIGHLGAFSFHETKNIISGEGGALLINDKNLITKAEVIREKGTNRCQFFRGEIDKYTWIGKGSSYLPSEIVAAFLYAQIEEACDITQRRLAIWNKYHQAFEELEVQGFIRRPIVPQHCSHNAHMYYILLQNRQQRSQFMSQLQQKGIETVFHYVPLHTSPYGKKYVQSAQILSNTVELSENIVRLPLWLGIEEQQGYIIEVIYDFFRNEK